MKKLGLVIIIGFFGLAGCAGITRPFTVESPRANRDQITAVKDITTTNVPVIVGAQTDKQRRAAEVARVAIHNIVNTKDTVQAEAITNIAANAITAIKDADGTAKILGHAQEKAAADILQMPLSQYMAYAASQGIVASRNQDTAYRGIKAGWQWTSGKIAEVAGMATGGTGVLAYAVSLLLKKKKVEQVAESRGKLLKTTGKVIDEFASKQPGAGGTLKTNLATAHSVLPVDAKKEFGLT